ncbi:hypothetical protein EUU23_05020 [Sphingorhabdus sp. IMCC26285]|uniref:HEPN domain-containing protein n=1 Tax=Sphingorhabdus profundilacus TaxID=2509718 RepID=A0A6I4M412_9SPHN|nr:hypothetical protein [Sphingorhabdus profundilacus]MVZ97065.1 hypothetical protein [Sphingorhabdus profundilacus]
MAMDLARQLFETGRSHALASDLLYRSAILDGQDRQLPDPEHFAFNGTYSLSTHYLLGLGLELMLKAAIVGWGGAQDEKPLRDIGHDLIKALDLAEAAGFKSEAPNLRDILVVLNEPFKLHWFRYGRPDQFALPGNFTHIVAALEVLDDELQERLWTD